MIPMRLTSLIQHIFLGAMSLYAFMGGKYGSANRVVNGVLYDLVSFYLDRLRRRNGSPATP